MPALKWHIEREGLSQTKTAKVFGVTQPRISNLMRGKIELFGLDMPVNILAAAGLRVKVQVKKAREGGSIPHLKIEMRGARAAARIYDWPRREP
jgi:transcriptional regulator with XRE-family HTH domain